MSRCCRCNYVSLHQLVRNKWRLLFAYDLHHLCVLVDHVVEHEVVEAVLEHWVIVAVVPVAYAIGNINICGTRYYIGIIFQYFSKRYFTL